MKRIAIILCLMAIVGCGPALTEKDLPSGYCVMKAIDADVYTLQYPDGYIDANVWNTKHKAIKFAIFWDKEINKKYHYDRDDHIWPSCERRKDQ